MVIGRETLACAVLGVVAVLTLGANVRAWAQPSTCQYSLAQAPSPPAFTAFPVAVGPGTPAAVHLRGAQDRQYRTMLQTGAAAGPNFAGHYTIASWGCGSACVQWAIIDSVSGRVTWPAGLGTVSAAHLGGPSIDDPLPLRFRADSRLLVVLGAPLENESREGIAYYRWNGQSLQRLGFVPARQICHAP